MDVEEISVTPVQRELLDAVGILHNSVIVAALPTYGPINRIVLMVVMAQVIVINVLPILVNVRGTWPKFAKSRQRVINGR